MEIYIQPKGDYQPTTGIYLTNCTQCKRKILVSLGIIGPMGPSGVSVCCGDCLEINEEFSKENPVETLKIEAWKDEVSLEI